MLTFKRKTVSNIDNTYIDNLYLELLDNNYQFMILSDYNTKYVLTKERSLIPISDENKFINEVSHDVYYKTIIEKEKNIIVNVEDLELYHEYLNKYIEKMSKNKYGNKYYFGCIAVKTDHGFITTIRGKENFDEYTIVTNVNHEKHVISVINKKASLNAPLLDYLFKNESVKVIVHLHDCYDNYPYQNYAFPGTVKDSIRDNTTTFNIQYHGIVYLFDKDGNIL